ncbi:MAG TPA: D-alanine--D-alanine ligase family protein [Candidatus Limnocylindrales bacterium]|nr:D-alanine--D-alanine ligase family protein [Candidatus Limnocylindrales bacterium]
MSDRIPVVVVLGGPSAEHDVSLVSGSAVAAALAAAGHPVERVLIDLDGDWWSLPGSTSGPASGPAGAGQALAPADFDRPAELGAEGPLSSGTVLERLRARSPRPVVFIALHGPFGEDGTIQALLEAADLPYTGSGVAASALGMDKALFKRMVRGLGLPVVDWREVSRSRWIGDPAGVLAELEAFAAGIGDPRLIVKPARLGSSVGMTLAHDATERPAALDAAFEHDSRALVERFVADRRELEVAILGNDGDPLEEYGPGEILSGHEFYDYAAKYTPGLSETSPSAEIDPRLRATILKIARDAYRAIGAEGFARLDFLVDGDRPYLSEINTIPGFTPISLFPAMAAAGGYDFAALAERIVELGQARWQGRARRRLVPGDLPR